MKKKSSKAAMIAFEMQSPSPNQATNQYRFVTSQTSQQKVFRNGQEVDEFSF